VTLTLVYSLKAKLLFWSTWFIEIQKQIYKIILILFDYGETKAASELTLLFLFISLFPSVIINCQVNLLL
jgi:hypothetical protein